MAERGCMRGLYCNFCVYCSRLDFCMCKVILQFPIPLPLLVPEPFCSERREHMETICPVSCYLIARLIISHGLSSTSWLSVAPTFPDNLVQWVERENLFTDAQTICEWSILVKLGLSRRRRYPNKFIARLMRFYCCFSRSLQSVHWLGCL